MAKTLVFLEHHEDAIAKGSLGVLTKAAQLGGELAGVLVGAGVRKLAESAGAYGAATVWVQRLSGLVSVISTRRSGCA